MKKIFLKIPLLMIFALGVVAQQPTRIQRDVTYLASDELEGRLTGSKGATEAARYIANEFEKVGLKPLPNGPGKQESASPYLQQFPYVGGVSLGKRNSFIFRRDSRPKTQKLDVGSDWLPLGFSSSTKVEGGVVFVGYGITASELNHDDYADANAVGKI